MDSPSDLNIRKRRQRPSEADNEAASSHAGTTHEIGRAKAWLETLLDEQKDGKRVMSPSTEKRAGELLQLCCVAEAKEDNQEDTLTAIRHATTEMEKRLAVDEKYAPAVLRLRAFQVDAFRLRYGDYLASLLGQMRRDAKEVDKRDRETAPEAATNVAAPPIRVVPEAWDFFMSQGWTKISKRLEAENWKDAIYEEFTQPRKNNAPLVRIVQIIGAQTGQSPRRLIEGIRAYALRNAVAHQTLGDLAKEKRVWELRNELEADLRDLKSAPVACQGDVPAIRQAIFSTAHKYFEPFVWD